MMEVSQAVAFNGDAARLSGFLRGLENGAFYTYALVDPAGIPFYVGKGKANHTTTHRVLQHQLEAMRASGIAKSNPFKCSKIRSILRSGGQLGYWVDRVFGPDQELECLQREEALIAQFRRRSDGGVLTNLAAGLGSLSARDPFSARRHAATLSGASAERPERTALNLFLRSLGGVDSVPIKPLSEYRTRLVAAYPSPKALRTPSRRNGLTIAAAALGAGLLLEPGVRIPRVFDYHPDPEDWPLEGPPPEVVPAVIENGAMSDVLKLGLATLQPAASAQDEALILDAAQLARLEALIGHAQLSEWGLRPQK